MCCCSLGLRSLEAADGEAAAAFWTQLARGADSFVFHDRSALPPLLPNQLRSEAEVDAALIGIVAEALPHASSGAPTIGRLVALLAAAAKLGSSEREATGHAAHRALFALVADAGRSPMHAEVAGVALPPLLQRCREVLRRFVDDERRLGQFPVARARLTEVLLLLELLKGLDLDPCLPVGTKPLLQQCKKRHLLLLYPLLCELITSRENQIKQHLKEIFLLTAAELGIDEH